MNDIYLLKISNAVYDEIHIKEGVESMSPIEKEPWKISTRLKAMFQGDLEAGNIRNNGIKIEKFAIKRRNIGELKDVILDYRDFENNKQFVYQDYTQPNDHLIYSIVPIGENGLEGLANSVNIESDFVGYFIVDRDTNEVIEFDTFISNDSVETSLNQGRTEIFTMNKFPHIFYTNQEYHTFTLSAVFIPNEWERSGKDYQRFLDKFIRQKKPFIVKGSNGDIFVADIHSVNKSNPLNTYKGRDYIEITVEGIEVDDYFDFMNRRW